MKAQTIFLWVMGVFMIFSGICYVAMTETVLGLSGMLVPTPTGKIDAWATYGGLMIGFGSWQVRSAWKQESIPATLMVTVYIMGSFAFLRLLGMVVHGFADTFLVAALAFEIPITLLAWWLYHKAPVSPR